MSDLLLLDDLEDPGKTSHLPSGDLAALRAVGRWITEFVVKPHEDLGRSGPVCPFVPGSVERETLWLTAERFAGRDVPTLVNLMHGYRSLFRDTPPVEGDDATYKVIVVVFPDLAPEAARAAFGAVLEEIATPSYLADGVIYGPFYEGNPGTAIHNVAFRPFQSPVPFLFVRQGVVSDWKFFLDDEDAISRWGHRFGAAGTRALSAELRRLPWRERRD